MFLTTVGLIWRGGVVTPGIFHTTLSYFHSGVFVSFKGVIEFVTSTIDVYKAPKYWWTMTLLTILRRRLSTAPVLAAGLANKQRLD
jgi:hypothetical protein